MSNSDNWPEPGEDWSAEWRLMYWATREVYTDSVRLFNELDDRGLNDLFHDTLVILGYPVNETPSGMKEINLSYKEQTHSIRRIARFVLEFGEAGKSAELLSSELRQLGHEFQRDME